VERPSLTFCMISRHLRLEAWRSIQSLNADAPVAKA